MRIKLITINKISIAVCSLALLFSCNNAPKQSAGDNTPPASAKTFTVKDGWGYSIYLGKKEFIRQLSIPCIQGNIPFQSDSQAQKAANLVVAKIKAHQLPALTIAELESNQLLPVKDTQNINH